MDAEELQSLFEERYAKRMGASFADWIAEAPTTEDDAYDRLHWIDGELKATYEPWFEAKGPEKDALEDYREQLKAEYDLLEQVFGLEPTDS